ncbi:MAG: hypothetical protein ACX94C_12515 [Phycisphaerales bacterium]
MLTLRTYLISVFSLGVLALCAIGPVRGMGVAPAGKAIRANDAVRQPTPRLDVRDFRCIVVGDSQTTGPNSNRIRTQFHRWDAPTVGAQVVIGNNPAGYVVNNGNGASSLISYRGRDVNTGWQDGGPSDFFAVQGHEWEVGGDLNIPHNRFGRFRLRFGSGNTDAPWSSAWGVGAPLRAYVAVRTSPMSVPAVELRAERGGVISWTARQVYELSSAWGVQVLELDLPADFNPKGDDIGIGMYFPDGYTEQAGQRVQVLGVTIERVGANGQRPRGTMIGYQGRGGWAIADHIDLISQASRAALIEMTDADHVMIILGHNFEPDGEAAIEPNLRALVSLWEQAYASVGRARPAFIYVMPWTIIQETPYDYLLEVERAMGELAGEHRGDLMVNYLPLHDYTRPDIYDPDRYTLDPRVHPADIPTADNLSQDLYEMLFEGRRE